LLWGWLGVREWRLWFPVIAARCPGCLAGRVKDRA
jgi:hypothetical protein